MIAYKSYYNGMPPELIASMETIAQRTLDEYYRFAVALYADKNADVWNCSVYRSTRRAKNGFNAGYLTKRVRIVNHSCGYWAVFEWATQRWLSGSEQIRFSVFAAQSDFKSAHRPELTYLEKRMLGGHGKIDWGAFQHAWGYGECDLYWEASKNQDEPWFAPTHTLDFKFPLLLTLRHAVDGVDAVD